MQIFQGTGCWPGKAEGIIHWRSAQSQGQRQQAMDRAEQVLRFRAEVGRALEQLDSWAGLQEQVGGGLLLQGSREALLEPAWSQRTHLLIDSEGLTAGSAALEAALQIAAVMGRSEELQERAQRLRDVGAWLADRCDPEPLPPGAILAAAELSPLQILDREYPLLLAGGEPPVRGRGPVVWGLSALAPHWHGKQAAIDGLQVTLDLPGARWLRLEQDRLGGQPLCRLNGSLEAVARMAGKTGRPPMVLVDRLDDLAAVPLLARQVSGVAVDLDRLGPAPRLKHPGFLRLLREAAAAAREAGVPLVAGGEPVQRQSSYWHDLGFTAFYTKTNPPGGQRIHAVRREQKSGM